MKIVVVGGTGLIGSKTVERLRETGHDVVAASPRSGVDTMTGDGLAGALAGAQAVIDLANSPSFEAKAALAFFETSGRNLLAAEKVAGVGHHLALSLVGTGRLSENGYFLAKAVQESLISTLAFRLPSSIRPIPSSSSMGSSWQVPMVTSSAYRLPSCSLWHQTTSPPP